MATWRTSAAGGSTSGTSNRTATIVPAVGDLLVAYCFVSTNTNDTPTCSDNNPVQPPVGGWTLVDVCNVVIATVNHRLSVFVRDDLMVNTTSTVVTVATGSNTSGIVHVHAISGMSKVGAAAVRSKGLQNNQAAGTAAPALNIAALTANLTIVAQGSADTTTTPPTNWTERNDTNFATPTVALQTSTRNSGHTGTTITFGAASSTTFCSHALELDTSAATRTATVAVSTGSMTFAATATRTIPTRTATVAVTTGSMTFSASALFAVSYTATLTLTTGAMTFAGVAEVPVRATLTLTTGSMTWASAVTTSGPHPVGNLTRSVAGLSTIRTSDFSGKPFSPPFSEATITLTMGSMSWASTAWTSAPHPVGNLTRSVAGLSTRRAGNFAGKDIGTFVADVSLLMGSMTFAASATSVDPTFGATLGLVAGSMQFAATATATGPVDTAALTLVTGSMQFAATATRTVPVDTATVSLTTGAMTFAAVATVSNPSYTAALTLLTGSATFAAVANSTADLRQATLTLTTGSLTFTALATFEAVDLFLDLLACYRLNGNLNDSSGSERHLLPGVPAPTYAPGLIGLGLRENGGVFPGPLGLSGPVATTPFSLSLWINHSTDISTPDRLGWDTGAGVAFSFLSPGGATADWTFTSIQTGLLASGTFPAGAWAHFAATFDGTTLIIYLNGSAVSTSTPAMGTDDWLLAENFFVLADTSHMHDMVLFYGRALTPLEVDRLWNDGDGFDPFPTDAPKVVTGTWADFTAAGVWAGQR